MLLLEYLALIQYSGSTSDITVNTTDNKIEAALTTPLDYTNSAFLRVTPADIGLTPGAPAFLKTYRDGTIGGFAGPSSQIYTNNGDFTPTVVTDGNESTYIRLTSQLVLLGSQLVAVVTVVLHLVWLH